MDSKNEKNVTDEFVDCYQCNGTGKEVFEDNSYDSPAERYERCQKCSGTGEIENFYFEEEFE